MTEHDTERATAFHEAGHAVACFEMNQGFTSISIVADDDSWGRVKLGKLPAWFEPWSACGARGKDLVERRVICFIAGRIAERRYLELTGGVIDDEALIDQGHHDTMAACDFLDHIVSGPEELDLYLQLLDYRATRTVQGLWWPKIEAVAEAVIEARSLTWRQARPIIRAAAAGAYELGSRAGCVPRRREPLTV